MLDVPQGLANLNCTQSSFSNFTAKGGRSLSAPATVIILIRGSGFLLMEHVNGKKTARLAPGCQERNHGRSIDFIDDLARRWLDEVHAIIRINIAVLRHGRTPIR